MKINHLAVLVSLLFANLTYAEEPMNKYETLVEFENLYNSFYPAQEKSIKAFVWFTRIPHPLLNAVMHLSCKDVRGEVDRLIELAPPHNPISFWIHSENHAEGLREILKVRGFTPIITCPLMAWLVKPVSAPKYDIRVADMKVFNDILSIVYQFDDSVRDGFQKLMDKSACENYIIYMDGNPVGTGTLLVNGSVGGIFNDATLPERREASEAMMQFLMHRSHELNLKKLILLSSPEAEALYSELGFTNLFNIELYCLSQENNILL
jgi:hypothetical protein